MASRYRGPPPGIPGVTAPCQVPISSKTRRHRRPSREPERRWGDGPQKMLAPRNWEGHACPQIADCATVQELLKLVPDAAPEVLEQVMKVVLDRAASGFGRDPSCKCGGWRTSVFRDALAQMDHPLLKVWPDEGCEHRGNDPSLPELEDLRRGGIADAVLACAQRPDKGFAIVGLYIAYIVALPPALLHHGAHGNFSKMVRLAVGSEATEEAARSVAALEHLDRICLETRPDRLDCRQLYVDAVVAARQGRIVRGALKRGSIVLPFCDGCGRRVEAARRCARCKHVFYCSVECQKAAWARPVAGHARTCAALGDLQKRAGAMTFGLDKMVCAECDFGPTTPDLLRWHCTLTQHRRWPERDFIRYEDESSDSSGCGSDVE